MSHDVNRICKTLCVLLVLALIGGAACRIRSTDPDTEGSGASNDVAASTTNETCPSETPTTPGKSTESSVTETSAAETLPPVDESRELAENLLGEMSLEQKVGQMFFASWVSGDVAEAIGLWHFGGIVLFAPDFEYSDPA
ncbi:MAG: hypothetical protein JW817_00245, partial [Clostridiales bacterium]|nr:hypothetical protein [Clostridiales bacterium]